jgi:CheY-like chemotaxis protein
LRKPNEVSKKHGKTLLKILFLDDDPNRRRFARSAFGNHELSEAETAEDAIKMLERYSPYDLVSLDHDLGGKTFTPSDETSGFEVARHILKMPLELLPKRVIIHSYNFPAAARMVEALSPIVPTTYEPFNPHG